MKHQELIERYFLGDLSSEEKEVFNQLLENDVEFKAEVEFQKDVKVAVTAEEDSQFKERLKSLETTPQKTKLYRTFWAAASILLLLAVSSILYFQTPSNEQLFAENFEPYANVIQPVVRGDTSEDLKTTAFFAYENKSFEEAAVHFSALKENGEPPYASFYLAISKLALNQSSEAIPLLEEVVRSNSKLSENANWYLALAHLNEDNDTAAKEVLQKIVSELSYNSEKAKVLLEKLK